MSDARVNSAKAFWAAAAAGQLQLEAGAACASSGAAALVLQRMG